MVDPIVYHEGSDEGWMSSWSSHSESRLDSRWGHSLGHRLAYRSELDLVHRSVYFFEIGEIDQRMLPARVWMIHPMRECSVLLVVLMMIPMMAADTFPMVDLHPELVLQRLVEHVFDLTRIMLLVRD